MMVASIRQMLGFAVWWSGGLTFVAVFLRFGRALWFVLSAVRSIADPNGSVPSEPRLNA
jgi:hypothetical protein